jgi:hypothetical protein
VLDYDKQGRVIGVELLRVRQLLTQGLLADADKAVMSAV